MIGVSHGLVAWGRTVAEHAPSAECEPVSRTLSPIGDRVAKPVADRRQVPSPKSVDRDDAAPSENRDQSTRAFARVVRLVLDVDARGRIPPSRTIVSR
jgi:hypothetical protein